MASAHQCELMRVWFSLSACISDTGLRPSSTSKAPCNETTLGTARYSTSLPYLKAKWLGTLIHLCCNSHLSCVFPFRLLKQKHHRPGGTFFILRVLTEGWLLYRILWFFVIHQQESSMGLPMPPPSWNFVPFPSPSHPSSWSQSPCLISLSHTANPCWLSILHVVM